MSHAEAEPGASLIKVLCVDDHPDIGKLLGMVVEREPDMELVGVLARAGQVMDELEHAVPDVILFDLSMPGEQPLTVIREIRQRHPEIRTLVFSAYDDKQAIENARAAGASGYVCKTSALPEIIEAIRNAARSEPPAQAD